ncbi:phospholipase A2 inhibitor and Ly6/PLAUR domain-containing protein-like [Bufo gargarizans]|uniref:phospholipase A2 inhibitor and Ly6/PLAUR domain-containing protein-like n=1 Tax=Bufo gargarizans TaxID=30331 RepID=UPI001CF5794F|nr:phospholipase A2 inhibitor and Ly6/PLAUR domain-containing protein-like [Bufo gargarizans]
MVLEAAMTMRSCLMVTCLLSAIAAKGYSLSCIECMSQEGTICNGTSKVCSSGDDSCISTYILTSMGGMEIAKMYIRQCAPNKMCSKTGSISLPNGRIKTGTTCCKTNDCTPANPVLPSDSNEKNGLSCKTCFTPNSKSCDTDLLTDCLGSETTCINQLTTRTGKVPTTTVVRGCSTKEMCEPAHQVWRLGEMTILLENTCTNRGVHVQPSLLLAIISLGLIWKSSC